MAWTAGVLLTSTIFCRSDREATQAGSASHCGLTFNALTIGVAQSLMLVTRRMLTPNESPRVRMLVTSEAVLSI